MLDTYQRYLEIFNIVQKEAVSANGKELSLLDVGSNGPGFASYNYFNNVSQVNLDIVAADDAVQAHYPKVRFIQYSGERIPFEDNSFDFVICVDVLEHVAPEHRQHFIREVIRTSRKAIIFVFPVKSSERWEKFLSAITFQKIKFLQEHIDFGLPSEEDFYRIVENLPGVVVRGERGNIHIWFWIPIKLAASLIYRIIKNHGFLIYKGFLLYKNTLAKCVNLGQCYSKTFILEKIA